MKTIGQRIREKRMQLNMTQDELARKLGYKSRTSINKIELGGHNLTQSKIKAIADALETTPGFIMGWEQDLEPVAPKMIPLYSAVSAGLGAVADGNIERYIIQPPELPHGEYFGLKVKGDSMEPYILDGDVVIARQDPAPADGSIVIVIVNGDEGFCKRLICSDDTVILMSLNSNYAPKVYTKKDVERLPVRFAGTVVKLIRDIM